MRTPAKIKTNIYIIYTHLTDIYYDGCVLIGNYSHLVISPTPLLYYKDLVTVHLVYCLSVCDYSRTCISDYVLIIQ